MPESLKNKKIPDAISAARERNIKDPYIEEHNIEGAKFRDGKITLKEWESFKKNWESRFQMALHNVAKLRTYTDISEEI